MAGTVRAWLTCSRCSQASELGSWRVSRTGDRVRIECPVCGYRAEGQAMGELRRARAANRAGRLSSHS